MSGMGWRKNRLIQTVGDKQGELGYVGLDENTGSYEIDRFKNELTDTLMRSLNFR